MLNSNRVMMESLQRTRRVQKNLHTTSITLRNTDQYCQTLNLPLRDTVNKRMDNYGKNYKKLIERSGLQKSPSVKCQKQNRYQPEYKLKVGNDSNKRVETDRKSLRKSIQKSIKSIRLRTDYTEVLQNRDKEQMGIQTRERERESVSASKSKKEIHNQVSTKHSQEYSNKIIYVNKSQLVKIMKYYAKLKQENIGLKKQIGFYCEVGKGNGGGSGNSVARAMDV